MIQPDPAAFPRAPLNPAAAPWARAVEKRILGVEKKAAAVRQRLDQAQRVIAAIKGRDSDGALTFQGDFQGGHTNGETVTYSGKWRFDFADGLWPKGWRRSSVADVRPGDSHWPDGFIYGYQHNLDGKGIVLTARPGIPAWLEFDLPAGQEGAVRWWYTYDEAALGDVMPDAITGTIEYGTDPENPNGPQILIKGTYVGPIEILTSRTPGRGGDADHLYSWGNGYGNFNVPDYGITGTDAEAIYEDTPTYRIEIRAAGPGKRSLYIDAIALATADHWYDAEGIRDSGAPDDGTSTVITPGTIEGGRLYHAGDVVSYNGQLWTALTDTDGSPPEEGSMWSALSGADEAAYEYAGEWTP